MPSELSQPFVRQTLMTVGPVGALEVYFEPCSDQPARTAVLCAPNPRAGGTMGHKVVHAAARALRQCGWHTLRFNYRGVGKSEGVSGEHGEERDDVLSVLDFAARQLAQDQDELLVAGFSFGSWVGIPVGESHPRVGRMIGIGLPLAMREFPYAIGYGNKPLLVIQGTADEFSDRESVDSWVRARPARTELVWVDCGHFFHGHLTDLENAITSFSR